MSLIRFFACELFRHWKITFVDSLQRSTPSTRATIKIQLHCLIRSMQWPVKLEMALFGFWWHLNCECDLWRSKFRHWISDMTWPMPRSQSTKSLPNYEHDFGTVQQTCLSLNKIWFTCWKMIRLDKSDNIHVSCIFLLRLMTTRKRRSNLWQDLVHLVNQWL